MKSGNSHLMPDLQDAFRAHIEKDHGLIAGPDRLLARTNKAICGWLKFHESAYREAGSDAEADAIRDLRLNLINP